MKIFSKFKMRTKLLCILLPPTACFLFFSILYIITLAEDIQVVRWNRHLRSALHPFEKLNYVLELEDIFSIEYLLATHDEDIQTSRSQTDAQILKFRTQTQNLLKNQLSVLLPYRDQLLAQLQTLPDLRMKIDNKKVSAHEVDDFFNRLQEEILKAVSTLDQLYKTQLLFTKPYRAYVNLLAEVFASQNQIYLVEQAVVDNTISVENLLQLAEYVTAQEISHSDFLSYATPEQLEYYDKTMTSPSFNEYKDAAREILKKNTKGNYEINFKSYLRSADQVRELYYNVVEALETNLENDSQSYQTGLTLKIIFTGVVLLFVSMIIFWLSWAIVRDIIHSIKGLQKSGVALVQKDLTTIQAHSTRKDEIGGLEETLRSLGLGWEKMVSTLSNEAQSISDSSSGILSTINQLVATQRETENSVIETNTTMEELRHASEVSAKKAESVVEFATGAFEVLKKSMDAIHSTVDDLNEIREKMGIISDSTTKLNDHTQAISQIMDSVHDLAEQSHVLAVNASIEAAKAGEQGKGFAVVAQEVRNLAEQSQEATKRVHTILTDIQNAMNTTVLATEQGSSAVKKGVSQSAESTDAITNLSSSIETVLSSAQEISAATSQQLTAVQQTTSAMGSIKEASMQQSDVAQSIEVNVNKLHQTASHLNSLMGEFKLPEKRNE